MRLTKEKREQAKKELLAILLDGPKITGEFQKVPAFHRLQKLSLWQIRTLLRETGKVNEGWRGQGMYTSTLWSLKKEAVEEVRKNEEGHLAWHKEHGKHFHNVEEWEKKLKK